MLPSSLFHENVMEFFKLRSLLFAFLYSSCSQWYFWGAWGVFFIFIFFTIVLFTIFEDTEGKTM